MIDIHSHVLYGVDDGARTIEDSVAMVQMAIAGGTTDLVLTPHANHQFRYDPEIVEQRLTEISEAAGGQLNLYSGCDFHLSLENINDAIDNPTKYTIDHKCYLLVEFSDLLIFNNTLEIFARLQDAGMIPVITHPERNALLRQRIEQIATWAEKGACVQITAQSLTGKFGERPREFCESLLERGLVHFVASDAHDCEHRPPRMNDAYAWIQKKYGQPLADVLCVTNPRAALAGDPLDLAPLVREPRKWYQFWR